MTTRILIGDVRERLKTLPADYYDCVVTSPPYWGLRDYGVEGQIGLEPTLGEHLAVMVDVFNEVRRVLKPSGVVFLNYGDCYAATVNGRSAADTKAAGNDDRTFRDKPFSTVGPIYGEPHAQAYGSDDTAISNSQYRDSSSQNRCGGRKDASSQRTSGNDVDHALGQVRGPLTQILESMQSLLSHLPIADCSRLIEPMQFSSAILDQAPSVIRKLVSLRAALESTNFEFSQQHPEGSHLSNMLSACLSSLQSCEIYVRQFADRLAEFSERPHCTEDSASLSSELARHIQCTVACCSLFASWDHIKPKRPEGPILKPKDLCMIPNRLAIALQEAGWWVRSEIIWGKPNPMPDSSGKYRPSTAHEKIFLLTKSGKSFYNADAVALPCSEATHSRLAQDVERQIGSERANGGAKTNGNMKAVRRRRDTIDGARTPNSRPHSLSAFESRKIAAAASGIRNNESMDAALAIMPDTRYLRNYEPAPIATWEIPTAAFSEAHFATFPPELVERCLLAGCPPTGRVLDPFGGAGTTALVADRFGLDCDLIELNPAYAEITEKRIRGEVPMFAEIEMVAA